jgi:hypothetical protein
MSQSNLERYKKDLDWLLHTGQRLAWAMHLAVHPSEFKKELKEALKDKYDEELKKLPHFDHRYQHWYSEAHAVVKQLIPDRLDDFTRHYLVPKGRKSIGYANYVIEDYLQNVQVRIGGEVICTREAAIPRFEQQLVILNSAQRRFESSLFDIRQLVQADLMDSEIDAARLLKKNGFLRAAGAIAGVVIEKHLAQVCTNHSVKTTKQHPTISDLNDALKKADAIDTPRWRSIQHLGDIRNLCDHNKEREPKPDEIDDLIDGTEKLIKTLF